MAVVLDVHVNDLSNRSLRARLCNPQNNELLRVMTSLRGMRDKKDFLLKLLHQADPSYPRSMYELQKLSRVNFAQLVRDCAGVFVFTIFGSQSMRPRFAGLQPSGANRPRASSSSRYRSKLSARSTSCLTSSVTPSRMRFSHSSLATQSTSRTVRLQVTGRPKRAPWRRRFCAAMG